MQANSYENARRRTSPFFATSFLFDGCLRGGSAGAKGGKESNDDDEDDEWAEIVKAETILEEDAVDSKDADEDDAVEGEGEEEASLAEDEYDAEGEGLATGSELESKEYDEPLIPSSMSQLYATFGVMILSRKLDLYNPYIVRAVRFAFVGYLVLVQLFLLYVRIQAKTANDRTPVTVKSPFTNLVQSQLQRPDTSNEMMKNLASSFLSSQSTVLEYDLKQAKSMQGGLLMNMAFMWLLHFKMEQIQPLMINTLTGLMNLVYSPLFQVYVLGRNLERPFKTPAMGKHLGATQAQASEGAAQTESEESTIDDEITAEPESPLEEQSEGDDENKDDDDNKEGDEEEVGGDEKEQ